MADRLVSGRRMGKLAESGFACMDDTSVSTILRAPCRDPLPRPGCRTRSLFSILATSGRTRMHLFSLLQSGLALLYRGMRETVAGLHKQVGAALVRQRASSVLHLTDFGAIPGGWWCARNASQPATQF